MGNYWLKQIAKDESMETCLEELGKYNNYLKYFIPDSSDIKHNEDICVEEIFTRLKNHERYDIGVFHSNVKLWARHMDKLIKMEALDKKSIYVWDEQFKAHVWCEYGSKSYNEAVRAHHMNEYKKGKLNHG